VTDESVKWTGENVLPSRPQAVLLVKHNTRALLRIYQVFIISFWQSNYSLRPILLFANTDVSITKTCLDTSILAKSIMDRRSIIFASRKWSTKTSHSYTFKLKHVWHIAIPFTLVVKHFRFREQCWFFIRDNREEFSSSCTCSFTQNINSL
jgi:hypothetical protein